MCDEKEDNVRIQFFGEKGFQNEKWKEISKGRFRIDLFFNPNTNERVYAEKWESNVNADLEINVDGEEILILSGELPFFFFFFFFG